MILASGSPQRRAILEQLGVAFDVVVTGADEREDGPAEEVAVENARRKGRAAASAAGPLAGSGPILGVDTVVALDGRLYGKPADGVQAGKTLRALSGATHSVISGVCVIDRRGERTATALTQVEFRALDEATIAWYVDTREWDGRAGGYAIQGRGAALVRAIHGDYLNVVGLPVATLLELLPSLLVPGISAA